MTAASSTSVPDLYVAYVQGRDDPQPIGWASDPDLDKVTRSADQVLHSWATSHSIASAPHAWVEDQTGHCVYDAWLARRRFEYVATGQIFVETAAQYWDTAIGRRPCAAKAARQGRPIVREFRRGEQREIPLPMHYPMFENPEPYGGTSCVPLQNPSMESTP